MNEVVDNFIVRHHGKLTLVAMSKVLNESYFVVVNCAKRLSEEGLIVTDRRANLAKYDLAIDLPADSWFDHNDLTVNISKESLMGRMKRIKTVERRILTRRTEYFISAANKDKLVKSVSLSEYRTTATKQKITLNKLSKEDKLFNLALTA